MENEEKDDTMNFNIDDLFKDELDKENQGDTEDNSDKDTNTDNSADNTTEAVSRRINEVKRKTESETQDRIAKELGYASYKEMQDANKNKILRDAGLDTDDADLMAAINKIVEKKLAEDPRIQMVDNYEAKQKQKFVDTQLEQINTFAGSNYTSVDQLPKDTLAMWEKTGNLKQAYLATHGEELLTKKSSSHNKGSLTHLADNGSSNSGKKARYLTDEEKDIYRSVLGNYTNEDDLAKKTRPID